MLLFKNFKKIVDWSIFYYFIIDEISMVGCTMFTKMHLKLQNSKSTSLQPFGGLNIIFS
jgi:hypothetical protein